MLKILERTIGRYVTLQRYFCQDTVEPYVSALVRCDLQIDPEVEQGILNGDKHRHHPGKRKHTPISVPERFVKAAHNFLENSNVNVSDLQKEAESLRQHLMRRRLPATAEEVRMKAEQIAATIAEKEGIDMESLSEEAREAQEHMQLIKVKHKLKTMIYNWKPTDFNKRTSLLYLLSCFSPNYATLHRIFSEITKNVPDFKPKTFLDFGSGLGSAIWAANECFPDCISETMCVDASSEMNDVCQLLLQDGDPNEDPWIKNLFFKRYLPPSNLIKYDLVVCAHSLMDMLTSKERTQVINNLWNKTQGMLVIVEHGSYAGHCVVIEAREYILKKFNNDPDNKAVHVIAPCQHDLSCPKLVTRELRPCSTPAKFHPLSFHKEKMPEMEKYSYIVLSKQKYKDYSTWPRLISPVLKRSGHVICRICNSNGKLYEGIATKNKSGKHMYKLAKCSKWGDVLPAQVIPTELLPQLEDQMPEADNRDSDTDSETPEDEEVSMK